MKIEFIKDYTAFDVVSNEGSSKSLTPTERYFPNGQITLVPDNFGRWLIENGFAKEYAGKSLEPIEDGDEYFVPDPANGLVWKHTKGSDKSADAKYVSSGFAFRSEEAAEKFNDYIKALVAVSEDPGFMERENKKGYVIDFDDKLDASTQCVTWTYPSAGELFFVNGAAADASLDKHMAEWLTIKNYEWRK